MVEDWRDRGHRSVRIDSVGLRALKFMEELGKRERRKNNNDDFKTFSGTRSTGGRGVVVDKVSIVLCVPKVIQSCLCEINRRLRYLPKEDTATTNPRQEVKATGEKKHCYKDTTAERHCSIHCQNHSSHRKRHTAQRLSISCM